MKLIPLIIALAILTACSVAKKEDETKAPKKESKKAIASTHVTGEWRPVLGDYNPRFAYSESNDAEAECKECDTLFLVNMPWNSSYSDSLPIAFIKPHEEVESSLYMNAKYFSNLVYIDAVSGDVADVGSVKPALLEKLSYRDVAFLLMHTAHIRTYMHLEASIKLVEEDDTESLYSAKYDAIHSYCTNECNDDEYSFNVTIDKKTGVVSVL